MKEPKLISAKVREVAGEWHIECRFSDGQKFAAIRVDIEFPALAEQVSQTLNLAAILRDHGIGSDA